MRVLKSFRKEYKVAAIESFRLLILPDPQNELSDIFMVQDVALADLCIVIRWREEIQCAVKSRLGQKLAVAFSEFGRIDHQVWRWCHETIIARPYDRQIRKRRVLR